MFFRVLNPSLRISANVLNLCSISLSINLCCRCSLSSLCQADDFGYGDLSVYGHPTQEWGPIDNMALNGMRFTQFYATSVFCSPSRVAVLTGRIEWLKERKRVLCLFVLFGGATFLAKKREKISCCKLSKLLTGTLSFLAGRHPRRVGAFGDKPVFMPGSSTGLPREEETLAESLKSIGYRTGMVGKWHLGTSNSCGFPSFKGIELVNVLSTPLQVSTSIITMTNIISHTTTDLILWEHFCRSLWRTLVMKTRWEECRNLSFPRFILSLCMPLKSDKYVRGWWKRRLKLQHWTVEAN